MALQTKYTITISGGDKIQAAALAVEFWTSKGFSVHSESYNCIVFRRNGYGFLTDLALGIFGCSETSWDEWPTQLTVLCQVRPQKTIWNLKFEFGGTLEDKWLNSVSSAARTWGYEFSAFCEEWRDNIDD